MANTEKMSVAIDAALDSFMVALFEKVARHIEGGHIQEARAAARKGLQVARDTHSEMTAIASEA